MPSSRDPGTAASSPFLVFRLLHNKAAAAAPAMARMPSETPTPIPADAPMLGPLPPTPVTSGLLVGAVDGAELAVWLDMGLKVELVLDPEGDVEAEV